MWGRRGTHTYLHTHCGAEETHTLTCTHTHTSLHSFTHTHRTTAPQHRSRHSKGARQGRNRTGTALKCTGDYRPAPARHQQQCRATHWQSSAPRRELPRLTSKWQASSRNGGQRKQERMGRATTAQDARRAGIRRSGTARAT